MLEKEFEELPVTKIFIMLSIPSVLSMVFSSIYALADGMFVGTSIGSSALAAVNLISPILLILYAISDTIAVGAGVKVSTSLGEGDQKKAKRIFSVSILMTEVVGLVFFTIGHFFLGDIIYTLIKDNVLASYAYEYARYFVYAIPFILPLFALDNFLRICGKARYSMIVNIAVAILNILLDYILIVKLNLGIGSAAMATVISMFIGSSLSFYPFFTNKLALKFSLPKTSIKEMGSILYGGSSEFFGTTATSLMALMTNSILLSVGGSVAVASYGIVMYIDNLLLNIIWAITDAVSPAVSYNNGARKVKRNEKFFKMTNITTFMISVIILVLVLFFKEEIAIIFSSSTDLELINLTTAGLVLFVPGYLFIWYNTVTSSFLTALDHPKEAVMIMLCQSVITPLISLIILVPLTGVYGVFLTHTVSSFLSFIVSKLIWNKFREERRKLRLHLPEMPSLEYAK